MAFKSGVSDMFFRTANFFNEHRSGSDYYSGSSHSKSLSRNSSREPSQVFGSQEPLFKSQKELESSETEFPNSAFERFVTLKPLASERKLNLDQVPSLSQNSKKNVRDSLSLSSTLHGELQRTRETLRDLSVNVEIVVESLKVIKGQHMEENVKHLSSEEALKGFMDNLLKTVQVLIDEYTENKQVISSLPDAFHKKLSEKAEASGQQNKEIHDSLEGLRNYMNKLSEDIGKEMEKSRELLNFLKANSETLNEKFGEFMSNAEKTYSYLKNEIGEQGIVLHHISTENKKLQSISEKLSKEYSKEHVEMVSKVDMQGKELLNLSREVFNLHEKIDGVQNLIFIINKHLKSDKKLMSEQKNEITKQLKNYEQRVSIMIDEAIDKVKEYMKNDFLKYCLDPLLDNHRNQVQKDLSSVSSYLQSLVNAPFFYPGLALQGNDSFRQNPTSRSNINSFHSRILSPAFPSRQTGHFQVPPRHCHSILGTTEQEQPSILNNVFKNPLSSGKDEIFEFSPSVPKSSYGTGNQNLIIKRKKSCLTPISTSGIMVSAGSTFLNIDGTATPVTHEFLSKNATPSRASVAMSSQKNVCYSGSTRSYTNMSYDSSPSIPVEHFLKNVSNSQVAEANNENILPFNDMKSLKALEFHSSSAKDRLFPRSEKLVEDVLQGGSCLTVQGSLDFTAYGPKQEPYFFMSKSPEVNGMHNLLVSANATSKQDGVFSTHQKQDLISSRKVINKKYFKVNDFPSGNVDSKPRKVKGNRLVRGKKQSCLPVSARNTRLQSLLKKKQLEAYLIHNDMEVMMLD